MRRITIFAIVLLLAAFLLAGILGVINVTQILR